MKERFCIILFVAAQSFGRPLKHGRYVMTLFILLLVYFHDAASSSENAESKDRIINEQEVLLRTIKPTFPT
jgi:hypothetical protein